MKTPFEILGLPNNTPLDEVKRYFRKLSLSKHPDVGGNENEYKELLSAYMKISCGYKTPVKASTRPRPNKTVTYTNAVVSLEDAMNCNTITIPVGSNSISVQLPYGVRDMEHIQYKGMGMPNKDGVHGTLDVCVSITPPEGFTFENYRGRIVLVYNVKFNRETPPKKLPINMCGKRKTIYLPKKLRDGMFLKVVGFGYPKNDDLYIRIGLL